MFKPARKTFTTLLTALLATCWVVGEAWHLVPGMAHLEEHPWGCLVVGAAPNTSAENPVDCDHGAIGQQSPCPLKVLSAEQCPICRVLSQNHATHAAQTLQPLPDPVHVGLVEFDTLLLSAAPRTATARAPPA